MDYSSIASSISSSLTEFENLAGKLKNVSFGSVWSGDAYNTQSNNLNKTVSHIQNEINYIKTVLVYLLLFSKNIKIIENRLLNYVLNIIVYQIQKKIFPLKMILSIK